MSWQIDRHPDGGLQITHLVAPRFTARWTTGDFPIESVRQGTFFWTDEGSGEEDAIHLYNFVWFEAPDHRTMCKIMQCAVAMVERYILGQLMDR